MHPFVIASAQGTSTGSILGAILSGSAVLLLVWVARLLWNITVELRLLRSAVFPDRKPSLPDQVGAIDDKVLEVKNEVAILRRTGTDRLTEILKEARVIRRSVTDTEEGS